MKKLIMLSLLVFAFLVTGCSVELETSSSKMESKADRVEAKAYELEQEFNEAKDLVNELEGKDSITSKDQKRISNQIDSVLAVIDELKEMETPVLGKTVEDFVGKNLNKREEALLEVQAKADEGTVTKEDLQKIEKAVSNDLNIKLF